MEIIFSKNQLQKLANDYKLCQRKMGEKRAKLYH
jgi:hypothetical protein